MGGFPAGSLTHYITINELVSNINAAFKNLQNQKSGDVSVWMDLIRTCRQPQIFWEVDYIEPKKDLVKINDIILESENILFDSPDSVSLKPEYTAPPIHQAAFNTVRMHLKSENGDIDGALSLMNKTEDVFYDDLPDIRKSNLLFHSCLMNLCCKKFTESHDKFDRHWSLNKYLSPDQRISLGFVDNQLLLQLVYWFFIKYDNDFQDFYLVRNSVRLADVWNHKKISLLYFMEHDCSWAASLCGLSFYNHAKTWALSLPSYEKKRSTPVNFDLVWMDEEHENFTSECVGQEKIYFELYNREIGEIGATDIDKADDYLHSYYQYQSRHSEQTNIKWNLIEFTKKHININDINTVVDLGPGSVPTPVFSQRLHYQAVDISEKSCASLRDQNVDVAHKPASRFMTQTTQQFNLCFSCDVLAHLNVGRLEILLSNCQKKCKYITAMIDTRDNFKSDILSKSQKVTKINLHRTVQSGDEWALLFGKYFDVQYEIEDHWVYMFGTKK